LKISARIKEFDEVYLSMYSKGRLSSQQSSTLSKKIEDLKWRNKEAENTFDKGELTGSVGKQP
jgi:hypothetical protein